MSAPGASHLLSRSWYAAPLASFLAASPDSVLGGFTAQGEFDQNSAQIAAWKEEIEILHQACAPGYDLPESAWLYFEFVIPRMGHRADAILVLGGVVCVLEFKIGLDRFSRADQNQAWDYALDLKNFHQASHACPIVPILIASAAPVSRSTALFAAPDGVYRPLCLAPGDLAEVLRRCAAIPAPELDPAAWAQAPYQPTPTIIEAARALYARHRVEAIARAEAGDLSVTSRRVRELMLQCEREGRKAICFVTGVPGAGKTLVGLNLATDRPGDDPRSHAVYLSGNGPLVEVLREALTRDDVERRRSAGEFVRKGEVRAKVKTFIQNVHHFRGELLRDARPPSEHVVIFDEAQRAWDAGKLQLFLSNQRRRGRAVPNGAAEGESESALLLGALDRRTDWGLAVALVGSGQEINTGEAGIAAWLEALSSRYRDWDVYLPPQLASGAADDPDPAGVAAAVAGISAGRRHLDPALHLAVSMRSFRAENLSEFVRAVIAADPEGAREAWRALEGRYPIVLTRHLAMAKRWVRRQARGTQRYGLLASSKAQRLKPLAVDVRVDVNPVRWFLDPSEDTRSSFYLEDAATEFDVQGLEVDWACVAWDGDLRYRGGWAYHDFRGRKWECVRNERRQLYLRNSYRVLLTRARIGMAICVPAGRQSDPTRKPEFYDETFRYLESLGLPVLA